MKLMLLIFCVCPAIVTSISISPNGNSPEIKMVGGMMVDVQKGFVPMAMTTVVPASKVQTLEAMEKSSTNYDKSKKYKLNATALSVNERYRRLIPYMTFYYANDLTGPTTESYTKTVEVEKVEIAEMPSPDVARQPKKIGYFPYRNIPRYHGNRLTQYNIASANPTKIYKDVPNPYHPPVRVTPNYNNYLSEHNPQGHDFRRPVYKPNVKYSSSYSTPTRKPYLNLYQSEDTNNGNVQYYIPEKDSPPKFKLVPYEQTPPVKVIHQNEDLYDTPNSNRAVPVPVLVPKEQVYIKPRLTRPQYTYDNVFVQQPTSRKPPAIISESYYEKQRPHELTKPVVESGFKPIMGSHVTTTETYHQSVPEPVTSHYDMQPQQVQVIESDGRTLAAPNRTPNQYEYIVDQPAYQPVQTPAYEPDMSKLASLGDLLNSLQLNKSIPKPITRDNVGASIRTLLQVLNALKAAAPQHNEVEALVLSTPRPFVAQKVVVPEPHIEIVEEVNKPAQSVVEQPTEPTLPNEVELDQEPYLAPVNLPSQHLDDYSPGGTTSQRFPLRQESDEEGGTPGRPGIDYPTLELIPPTQFDCKTQRYKGFFADPETRCQVWHYCDLNGGQASFLCPNGTIFSQAGLTCDWWFNVRCASTPQLYVLNESLYKFILPHSPTFPEDYSGPLVDKYLTLKFKEMEEQFRKNRKNKQSAAEKIDSEETEDSTSEPEITEEIENDDVTSVSESSVVVGSPGTSGNVERLQD